MTIRFFVFVERFWRYRLLWKNYFINDWVWWLMPKIYFLWMIVSDDASSTIEIYDLLEATSLLHLLNDLLSLSLSTYQSIRNVALERANISLYRWAKSFYKLIQSTVDDTTTTLIIYRNASIWIMTQTSVMLTDIHVTNTRMSINANHTWKILADCLS